MNIIDTPATRAKEKILRGALNPLRPYLPDDLIELWCREAKYEWRERLWGPTVTLLGCVWKQMMVGASSRQVEDWIDSFAPDTASAQGPDGSDFCAARKRLPFDIFEHSVRHTGQALTQRTGFFFKTLPVMFLDGTTLRLPNTAANDAYFGRSSNGVRSSRSPVGRLLVLVCAGAGAVLDYALGSYRTSEWELFYTMLSRMLPGGVLVADRGFCSYMGVALLQRHNVHVLTRSRGKKATRRIKRLGYHDEIQEWSAPGRATRPDLLSLCPSTLQIRVLDRVVYRKGYRSQRLYLVTTLLDRHAYPPDQLVELYLKRWDVELGLRELKSYYKMDRLTGKTPDIARKEILSIALARNLVLSVMADSGAALETLSHTRARRLIVLYAERMASLPTVRLPELYRQLLAQIKRAVLVRQERPPQPRSIVQRPSPYPVLILSRKDWYRAYLSA